VDSLLASRDETSVAVVRRFALFTTHLYVSMKIENGTPTRAHASFCVLGRAVIDIAGKLLTEETTVAENVKCVIETLQLSVDLLRSNLSKDKAYLAKLDKICKQVVKRFNERASLLDACTLKTFGSFVQSLPAPKDETPPPPAVRSALADKYISSLKKLDDLPPVSLVNHMSRLAASDLPCAVYLKQDAAGRYATARGARVERYQ